MSTTFPVALNNDVNNIRTSAEHNALEWASKVTVVGDIVTSAPVVGVRTVTATAAEIFAGATRRANRRKMIIKNEDTILRFRIGPAAVTQQNGFPVEPQATVEFQFDPAVAVPIFIISEGTSLSVAVIEL